MKDEKKFDCVVTAGGLPEPGDPLYAYTKGETKALLDMGGRTMLERVIDALQSAKSVGDIVVVGLGSDLGMTFQRPIHHVPDQGGMISNVLAGIDKLQKLGKPHDMILVSSSDIPLLSGQMVDEFVAQCAPYDNAIYYNFVTEETMEKRFPTSNRTFVKLHNLNVAGGDILLADSAIGETHKETWITLTNARKHAWKLARQVGIGFLLKFLLRRVDFSDIEAATERVIGHPVKAVISPHAELAMDADKPHQVDLLRAELL